MGLREIFLVAYALLCVTVCYVCFFSDSSSSSINSFFTVTLNKKIIGSVERFLGKSAAKGLKGVIHYVVHEPNPLMQIFYLVVVLGAWAMMAIKVSSKKAIHDERSDGSKSEAH